MRVLATPSSKHKHVTQKDSNLMGKCLNATNFSRNYEHTCHRDGQLVLVCVEPNNCASDHSVMLQWEEENELSQACLLDYHFKS